MRARGTKKLSVGARALSPAWESRSTFYLVVLPEGVKPLEQRRMAVVPVGVERVEEGIAQIVDVQLHEGALQVLRVAEVHGEAVRLELEAPRGAGEPPDHQLRIRKYIYTIAD